MSTLLTPHVGSTIATQIRLCRQTSALSQAELAARTGVDPATISDWERGAHTPTLRSLFRLADALSVSPAVLLQYQPSPAHLRVDADLLAEA